MDISILPKEGLQLLTTYHYVLTNTTTNSKIKLSTLGIRALEKQIQEKR